MQPLFQIRKDATAPFLEVMLTQEGYPDTHFAPTMPGCLGSTPRGVTPIVIEDGSTVRALLRKCGRTMTEVALMGVTEVVDAEKGIVRYKWAPSDTSVVGMYYFGIELIDPSGAKLIWPYVAEMFPIEVTP